MANDDREFVAPVRGEDVYLETWDSDTPSGTDTEPEFVEPTDWDEQVLPVPVYLVDRDQEPEIEAWSSQRYTIESQPIQIAGARRNRSRLFIRNEGSDDVHLGTDATMRAAQSYLLSATNDRVIELWHNSAVWAVCADTESAVVSVIEEYTVPLNAEHG